MTVTDGHKVIPRILQLFPSQSCVTQWVTMSLLGNVGINQVKHAGMIERVSRHCNTNVCEACSSAFICLKLTYYCVSVFTCVSVCVRPVRRRCSHGGGMRPEPHVSLHRQRSHMALSNMFICCVNNSRAAFMSTCEYVRPKSPSRYRTCLRGNPVLWRHVGQQIAARGSD